MELTRREKDGRISLRRENSISYSFQKYDVQNVFFVNDRQSERMIPSKLMSLQFLQKTFNKLTNETRKPLGRWFNVKDHPNYIEDILIFKDNRKKRYSEKMKSPSTKK